MEKLTAPLRCQPRGPLTPHALCGLTSHRLTAHRGRYPGIGAEEEEDYWGCGGGQRVAYCRGELSLLAACATSSDERGIDSVLPLHWVAVLSVGGWGGNHATSVVQVPVGRAPSHQLSNGFGAESRRGSGLRDKFEGLLKGFSPAAKDLEPARTVHIDDSVSRRFARGADYNLKCVSPCQTQPGPTRSTGWLAIGTWQGTKGIRVRVMYDCPT